jgi:UDP-N-acetylmuramoyl-tripeptide--D-alanyl-D-alanine ligase
LVFTVGDQMMALDRALPKKMRGGHDATAAAMAERVVPLLRAGDIVSVKGSHGIGMNQIVTRLTAVPAFVVKS